MEYRIRKEFNDFLPECHRSRFLSGSSYDHWNNIGYFLGGYRKIRCKSVEEAREEIVKFHDKYIANTEDDESSIIEKFTL